MHVRKLESLIVSMGGSASQVDKVTRSLRDAMKLSTGGRGLNAPKIDFSEAAWILAAYAGSEIAIHAASRLLQLNDLGIREEHWERHFLADLAGILSSEEEAAKVKEVRISRTAQVAKIIWAGKDGEFDKVDKYTPPGVERDAVAGYGESSFRIEGVLSQTLLILTAEGLSSATVDDDSGELVAE